VLAALSLFSLLVNVLPAEAQTPLSSFVGTVRDTTGAVVVGAQITVTDENRGYTRTVSTDASGNYLIDAILEGTYTLNCELQGFKKFVRTEIPLLSRQVLRIDVTLEVGEVTNTVTVTEATPVVASETAEVRANSLSGQMMSNVILQGIEGFLHTPYLGAHQSAVLSHQEGASPIVPGASGKMTSVGWKEWTC